jgi:branched-chain amino acid transport system substrate-binding protein
MSVLLGVTVSATLLVVSCGSDDKTATESSSAATLPPTTAVLPSDSTPETAAPIVTDQVEPTTTMAEAITGEPVKVGVLYDDNNPVAQTPQIRDAAEGTAEYLNKEAGGIGGRPMEIVACSGANDPPTTAACAHKFVDEGVIAVLGLGGVWADNGLPIIQEAGILNLTSPLGANEFTSPVSYPFNSGNLTGVPALVKYMASNAVKRTSVIALDIGAAKNIAENMWCKGFESAGAVDCNLVLEAGDAADFTPAVQRAIESKPDAVFLLFGPAQCGRVMEAASQLGAVDGTIKWVGGAGCADKELVFKPLGDIAEGMYFPYDVTPATDTSDPEVETYLHILGDYTGLEPSNNAARAVSAVMTLVTIADKVGIDNVTGQSLVEFMKTVSGVKIFLAGTLDASKTVPNFPNLRGVEARVVQVKDGDLVDVGGGRFNPFDS